MSNQTQAQGYEGVILRVMVIIAIVASGAVALNAIATTFTNFGPPPPGVRNGQLAPCLNSNCLSSVQPADDAQYIAPLALTVDADTAMNALMQVAQRLPDNEIRTQEARYLFVRIGSVFSNGAIDVEFYVNEQANQIDMRLSPRAIGTEIESVRQQAERIRTLYTQEIE